MKLSTHYYILSLGEHTNRLYEAFRDSLIDIQNTWFPMESSTSPSPPALDDAYLRTLLQTVDHHFAQYYKQEPLGVVLVGPERLQSMFASLTVHSGMIIGRVEGDHSTTSVKDLGSIVWPIVKGAMASPDDKVARELEMATFTHNVAVGIDAVGEAVDSGVGTTLLVEDTYHVKPRGGLALIDDCDNVVDTVIDKVLAIGGNVIFVEDGSLGKVERMALILGV